MRPQRIFLPVRIYLRPYISTPSPGFNSSRNVP